MPKKALAEFTKKSVISTEKAVFKPTPYMIVFLQTAVQYMPETVKETAELCGMDRTLWYDWVKKDGFMDWYLDEYSKARRGIIPKLDSIGMKYAKKGSYPHWKDMNKKAGENLDEPAVVNNVTIPILQGMSKAPQTYKELEVIEDTETVLLPDVEELLPEETQETNTKWQPKNLSGFIKPNI